MPNAFCTKFFSKGFLNFVIYDFTDLNVVFFWEAEIFGIQPVSSTKKNYQPNHTEINDINHD